MDLSYKQWCREIMRLGAPGLETTNWKQYNYLYSFWKTDKGAKWREYCHQAAKEIADRESVKVF